MNHLLFTGFEVKDRGVQNYLEMQAQMRKFTESRDQLTGDQLWLLEHPAVYTQGTACKEKTIGSSPIPIVKSDRGGQITYHGPGQLVIYCLVDLRRRSIGVKSLVRNIETGVIDFLASVGLKGVRQEGAPGVYIDGEKIAALGLRVRKGCSYHGLSLNVDMDLMPFTNINPCGFKGLKATSLQALGVELSMAQVKLGMVSSLAHAFAHAKKTSV